MNNKCVLRNLNQLIRTSTVHYKNSFELTEVILTKEFMEQYTNCMNDMGYQIEFFDSTAIVTTPTFKNIFLPNQWFAIAAYAVDVYIELRKYKSYLEKVILKMGEKKDDYIKRMKNGTNLNEKNEFIRIAHNVLVHNDFASVSADKSSEYLWRFVSDYSWWSGQKTIDRGDFFLSVILNMLNLVNASQSYVADIVSMYGDNQELYRMVSDLASFTTNLEGITYKLDIPEPIELIHAPSSQTAESGSDKPKNHKIVISADDITNMKGKKK